MDNTNYKRKGIGLFILFVLAFVLIMFLPNIRQTVMERQYEKEKNISVDKKQEEEEEKEKHEKVSTMICSLDVVSYSFSYKTSGLQKYSKTESKEVQEEEETQALEECQKEEEEKVSGVETKCELNNKSLTKVMSYDFTAMTAAYRKDNLFEFKYGDSIETIKSDLENKGYTCG